MQKLNLGIFPRDGVYEEEEVANEYGNAKEFCKKKRDSLGM